MLAAHKLSNEPPGQTSQATTLVYEACLRLVVTKDQDWDNTGHFFKAAAEAMRRIVIKNARHKNSLKKCGSWQKFCMDGLEAPFESSLEDLLSLDESLAFPIPYYGLKLDRYLLHSPFD